MSTCSAHLQTLREAGLVGTRREGKRVFYPLAGDDVAAVGPPAPGRPAAPAAQRAGTPRLPRPGGHRGRGHRRAAAPPRCWGCRDPRRAARGRVCRKHLPGAVNIPLEQLAGRLSELPRDAEVVAYCRGQYCVLAHDAVRLLTGAGLRAKRATEGCLSGGSPECPSSPAQPEPTRTRCGTTSAWAEAADKRPLPD